jgi:hypothetical protein
MRRGETASNRLTTPLRVAAIGLIVIGGGFYLMTEQCTTSQAAKPTTNYISAVRPRSQTQNTKTSSGAQYLIFQIFTYPITPQELPASQLDSIVQTIVNTVGSTGAKGRKLGFAVGPMCFDMTDSQLTELIDNSFTVAEKYNVAVMFHIDDSMFWESRQDLWSQHQNVEWVSWSGAEGGLRTLPWYSGPALGPQMCYNSPGIESAISTLVGQVVGSEIQKNVAQLETQGKSDLFAGIITGWETQLPDVTPPDGYCALTNLGYSATNPPADIDTALVGVVHDFLQFWDQQFVAAGIDPNKLYTHIATVPPGTDDNHAPLSVGFNSDCHAGFTAYGSEGASFPQIYQALVAEGAQPWGVSEGSNIYPPNAQPTGSGLPDLPMAQYLAGAYNHGATYVNLFGWQATGTPFYNVLVDPSAIKTYRKFLKGKKFQ